MRYPRSFFMPQIAFAERIAARFGMPFADALRNHTAIAEVLTAEDSATWQTYTALLAASSDPLETTFQFSQQRPAVPDIAPDDAYFRDWPRFGCFFVAVREDGIIRPHYLNNDLPGMRALGHERADARRADLRRLFTFVRDTVPNASEVRGHSWLYNLPAYRRLFPPSYTQHMVVNPDGVLQHMVLWFQCYDRFWEANPTITTELLRRAEQATDVNELARCFPYQRLRTSAPIADFYAFYGIADTR